MTKLEQLTRWIIEAIHQKPYEEALIHEITQFGCNAIVDLMPEHYVGNAFNRVKILSYNYINNSIKVFNKSGGDTFVISFGQYKNVGLPITLARVLKALDYKVFGQDIVRTIHDPKSNNPFREIEVERRQPTEKEIIERKKAHYKDFRKYAGYNSEPWTDELEILSIWEKTNEDGSDCTLEQQSKETIDALYELFKPNKHDE